MHVDYDPECTDWKDLIIQVGTLVLCFVSTLVCRAPFNSKGSIYKASNI